MGFTPLEIMDRCSAAGLLIRAIPAGILCPAGISNRVYLAGYEKREIGSFVAKGLEHFGSIHSLTIQSQLPRIDFKNRISQNNRLSFSSNSDLP